MSDFINFEGLKKAFINAYYHLKNLITEKGDF